MAKEAQQQAAAQKAQEQARPAKRSRTKRDTTGAATATDAPVAQAPATDDEEPVDCEACMTTIDQKANRLRGPCKHVYCLTCLALMARQTLENRALVPVRCCGEEFPIEYVERVLGRKHFAQYQRFLAEKDWWSSNLKSDNAYAEMVKKVNGKQCPMCGVGVQKIDGCLAMKCPRGHYFCWNCCQYPCTCGHGVPALRAHGH